MIQVGQFNELTINRKVDFGVYLDDGGDGILLPKRFVPSHAKIGDQLKVFIYHDSDNRLVATTQQPFGVVGDVVSLEAVAITKQGAFLDWGLMKDLFVAKSQQISTMRVGGRYLVKIYLDEMTGRVAATEKIEKNISNEVLTVQEKDEVDLVVQRKTEIGYMVVVNGLHLAVLHDSDVFRPLEMGEQMKGFVKAIKPGNKIDVMMGKAGYAKVDDAGELLLEALRKNGGYLPLHDKTDPQVIYDQLGMSKKAFKMTCGNLYKQRLIELTGNGIKLC
jgi:uncharacterized protein